VEAAERVLADRVSEARQNISALEAARHVAEYRRNHFEVLLASGSLASENRAEGEKDGALERNEYAKDAAYTARFFSRHSDLTITATAGFPPSVSLGTTTGASLTIRGHNAQATIHQNYASSHGIRSSWLLAQSEFVRREEQWSLEIGYASRDIERIDQEII